MNAKEREYSLLAEAAPPRDLPIALAHCISSTRFNLGPRMALLNRIYDTLTFGDRMRCRVELELCRAAKRGELRAEAV